MDICFISDTHSKHDELEIPESIDLLIHAGDICSYGSEREVCDFIDWFNALQVKHKVFIPGNHDFYLENISDNVIRQKLDLNVHYLNDSGVDICGLKIWGSPVQPWFFNWAFNRNRGADIKKHWDLIPTNTDILITHGPPQGILDRTLRCDNVGCADLLKKVNEINLKIHVFGHIHEGYGTQIVNNTQFINASVLNTRYELINKPIQISLPT